MIRFYSANFNLLIIIFCFIVESLPNEISSMIKLETLNLSENLLKRVPPSIIQLKNLKTINLSKNNLASIPRELCQIEKLDSLDLSSNKINQVEDYVEPLNCIELNLNENRISSLSVLKAIPSDLMKSSNVALLAYEGNMFTQKQFALMDGYDQVKFNKK